MIKAMLFDFGQTLVDSADGFRAAEKEAQKKIFSDLNLTTWDEFMTHYRRIRKEFQDRSNFSRPAMWEELYWYHCRASDAQLLGKWEHDYWQTVKAHTNVFPETKTVLEKLRAKYRLAMITNTQGQKTTEKHRLVQYPELERFFEVIIVAGEAGIPTKPDQAVFLTCLEKLGLAPSEAVYVGDDWRIDICGAQDAGLQPIWLQHHSVQRNWPQVETTVPLITSLEQLLELESIFGTQP